MSFGEKLMLEEYDSPLTLKVKKQSIDVNDSRNLIIEKTSFAASVANELKGPLNRGPDSLHNRTSSKSVPKKAESHDQNVEQTT